ncbi:hypothetical protein QF52_003346 [Salmonella enterica subsp. enterica]|nr:hypothetical protein [Salmonella enterica subsp. enterica serovar Hessarek]EEJ0284488.1 hypothetical protein [Salmonella enterica subsp. enterica]EJI2508398.1 hypothetical protein [Salmonella enterica]EEP8099909.1 hypothetical protein [Salmonella enterica subsp. enterica]EJI5359983.1 hypothetical protein [Salmonella enterica]
MGTGLAIAAGAMSAATSVLGGIQQSKANKAQASQARNQAADAESSARVQAEKIRNAALSQASEANASYAGSGVEVGEGSALKITSDIVGKGEHDAWSTIYSGENTARQLRNQANQYDSAAKNALIAGGMGAGTSILSTGAKISDGWKKPKSSSSSGNGLIF